MISIVVESVHQNQVKRLWRKGRKNVSANIGCLHEIVRNDVVGDINDLKPLVQLQYFTLHPSDQMVR
jgi:hypothetical protein